MGVGNRKWKSIRSTSAALVTSLELKFISFSWKPIRDTDNDKIHEISISGILKAWNAMFRNVSCQM